MAIKEVKCPYCGSKEVSLYGKNSTRRQRYLSRNKGCSHKTFQLEYKNNAVPSFDETMMNLRIGNGILISDAHDLEQMPHDILHIPLAPEVSGIGIYAISKMHNDSTLLTAFLRYLSDGK